MTPKQHSWWGGWGNHVSPSVSSATVKSLQAKIAQLERTVKGGSNGTAQANAGTNGGAKVKGKWWCLLKDCEKSAKGALNNATRTTCFCCGQQKGYCMSPPAHLCRTVAQDQVAAAKVEANKASPAQGGPKVVAPLPKAAPKPKEQAPAKASAEPLPSVPSQPCILDYDKGRAAPPTTVTVKTVEELLLGAAPKDKAFALANARDEVAHWQSSLDSAKKGLPGSSRLKQVPDLQKELDAASATVIKLEGEAPVTACSVTLLEKSITDHRHHSALRTDAWQKGADKAKLAEESVVETIKGHIKEWQDYLAALEEDAQNRRKAWTEHHDTVLTTSTAVEEKLKERLKAAEAAVPLTPAQLEANKAMVGQAEADRLAKEQLDSAMEAFKQLNVAVAISRDDYKIFTQAPPKETVGTLAAMFYWANSSSMGDAHLPFTLEDMQCTVEVARSLVGNTVWGQFFGAATVTVKAVVPMQLRQILFRQLMRYEAQLKGTEHCFVEHHAATEQVAQAALDDAGPRLAKLKALVGRGSPYAR